MITACKPHVLQPAALLPLTPLLRRGFPCLPARGEGERRKTGAASLLVVRRRCQEEEKQQQSSNGGEQEKRTFLSLEEAGIVEMSGLSTHERFLCRLTISSLNLLRVISEQEGVPIEELNAGRVCDWFLKDKLNRTWTLLCCSGMTLPSSLTILKLVALSASSSTHNNSHDQEYHRRMQACSMEMEDTWIMFWYSSC